MSGDQLTRNERIRLEALNQANFRYQGQIAVVEVVIETARQFEAFLREADQDHPQQ